MKIEIMSPQEIQAYRIFKAYWSERISWHPTPYQFITWLNLYRLDALKEAVRCTSRWMDRSTSCPGDDEGIEQWENDVIRYFSATARNIQHNMVAAESLEANHEL